jgi:hypothetical protein
MRKNHVTIIVLVFALLILLPGAGMQAAAQAAKAAYTAMAPLDQYQISDEQSEIALARSAAPSSISDGAEIMVLGREGYKTAVKGTNGFLSIVERSWAQSTRMTRSSGIQKCGRPIASTRKRRGALRRSI